MFYSNAACKTLEQHTLVPTEAVEIIAHRYRILVTMTKSLTSTVGEEQVYFDFQIRGSVHPHGSASVHNGRKLLVHSSADQEAEKRDHQCSVDFLLFSVLFSSGPHPTRWYHVCSTQVFPLT